MFDDAVRAGDAWLPSTDGRSVAGIQTGQVVEIVARIKHRASRRGFPASLQRFSYRDESSVDSSGRHARDRTARSISRASRDAPTVVVAGRRQTPCSKSPKTDNDPSARLRLPTSRSISRAERRLRAPFLVQTTASSGGEGANEDTQLVTQAKDRPGSGRGNAQKRWSGWREPSLRSSPPTASSSRSTTGPRNDGCRMPNLQELQASTCSAVRGSSVRLSLRQTRTTRLPSGVRLSQA
jgi:hypothetical protein